MRSLTCYSMQLGSLSEIRRRVRRRHSGSRHVVRRFLAMPAESGARPALITSVFSRSVSEPAKGFSPAATKTPPGAIEELHCKHKECGKTVEVKAAQKQCASVLHIATAGALMRLWARCGIRRGDHSEGLLGRASQSA